VPINKPGKTLLRDVPLHFVAAKVHGGGRKSTNVELTLVPFIDLLVVLVVFLLISFSASGELLAQKPNLTMPKAEHVVNLDVAPVVAIDTIAVTLDGRPIADTATLASDPKVERLEPLIQELDTMKRNWAILHPQENFPGQIVLQADVTIDFRVVKKIMLSAAQAGYANVSFAVNRVQKK